MQSLVLQQQQNQHAHCCSVDCPKHCSAARITPHTSRNSAMFEKINQSATIQYEVIVIITTIVTVGHDVCWLGADFLW